ncbi:MAG TPA: fumarylacetoacetate hydrolase family protein [Flavobacteriaceae bacterium]|nr:fumarylacetoacetate hydrolase family protein [Flavobacteriaceae bacterium]
MKKTVSEIASILLQAEKSKVPCPPIRGFFDGKDLKNAYRVQQFITDQKIAVGQKIVGKKIGLTSEKVQAQLGVNEPDFGILLNTMQIQNGETLSFSKLMQPKAEAEIAFILKDDLLQTNNSLEDLKNAIDFAVAAIEIVGSRIDNWNIQITDTIADNASASHFVLGEKKVALENFNLESCGMHMEINGQKVSEGSGKACLGNPLNAAVWLADKMMEMGNPLKKGEIILSGALGPMVNLNRNDKISAEIDKLGKVEFSVSE